MRIAKLEILRNTYSFSTQIQDRSVAPGEIVGQVALKGDDGAEIVLPLTEAQITAALAAVAPSAAGAMRDLGAAVHAGMFSPRPALEHAPSVDDFVEAPAGWMVAETSTEAPALTLADFQVGQRWRTRSGQLARILSTNADDAGKYPILAEIEDGQTPLYVENGRYFAHDLEDDRDLVALVDSPLPLAVGQRWLARGGLELEVVSVDLDRSAYPVLTRDPDGLERYHTPAGRMYSNPDDESAFDLVRIVEGSGALESQPCAG